MFKKIFLSFLFLVISFLFLSQKAFADGEINIYFFYGDGCPHCAKEEKFLDKLEKEFLEIKINRFETWHSIKNASILSDIAKNMNLTVSGVPILIIGNQVINGYYSDETTGQKIKEIISEYIVEGCDDEVSKILGNTTDNQQCIHKCDPDDRECLNNCGCTKNLIQEKKEETKINIPILGEVEIKSLSLPIITILIAALDGFNPCAMWILLFLITMLLGMKDRRKMWLLGLAFIISSGLVYFLFLSAWLNLFLFLGFIFWLRLVVGLVALGSGYKHLKEYFKNKKGTCHVSESKKRKKVFLKIKEIIETKTFLMSLFGIIILAAVVNLVELVCSAGLPAIYTQVLVASDLPVWQYYSYLILYIFIFILDDLFVFIIAMSTLKMKAISSKYTRWSNLLGGILIIIIGLLLILKPGWIMFG